jgi:NAD(P)-dependent dehydrogenase (short-subunit alcohol dehydrogenase family)
MYGLDGKVALVTGGGAGIGQAIALRLADEGADVALLDRDGAGAKTVAAEIVRRGRRALALEGDVTDLDAAVAAAKTVIDGLGKIDVLVNNAGIVHSSLLVDMDPALFDATLAVNVGGVFRMCKAVVPHMIERGSGAVINMASWAGKSGRPYQAAYSASKFAVVALTQALAGEVGKHGIRVNAICPGIVVNTAMRAHVEQEMTRLGLPSADERLKQVPLGRTSVPEDLANVAAWLASDQSSYVTGESINVSGGLWMD